MAGLSSELQHKGATFYVQTQDMGPQAKMIEALVYESGKVLATRKASYSSLLGSPDLKGKVAQLMKDLHQQIIQEIEAGRFDRFLPSPGGPGSAV